MMTATDIRIDVLVFDGCPNAETALALLRDVLEQLAPGAAVNRMNVDTPEKAVEVGFLGSPSIRVNGRDIEGLHNDAGALGCRTYDGSGVPPRWLLEAAILQALGPRGILFLCVANSARSQMAEGIARLLAPAGVRVWSAGSRPTKVRAEAISVLKEIGIDISSHRSKAVAEIPPKEVDAVITLCAEQDCPLFLGRARRLHWGVPDPAVIAGSDEVRLAAFRNTRDDLRRRIKALLAANTQEGGRL